jgi:hypothetical protein
MPTIRWETSYKRINYTKSFYKLLIFAIFYFGLKVKITEGNHHLIQPVRHSYGQSNVQLMATLSTCLIYCGIFIKKASTLFNRKCNEFLKYLY